MGDVWLNFDRSSRERYVEGYTGGYVRLYGDGCKHATQAAKGNLDEEPNGGG
jgi:hypothetical protein